MDAGTLLTRRDALHETRWQEYDLVDPDPGSVLVRVEHVALTANVFTYGTTGDALGYWKYWPAGDPQWGCLPAWGVGTVVAGDAVAAGSRLAGFLPLASHAVLRPERVTDRSLRDGATHRRELMPVYQHYERLPGSPAADDGLASLLRPLVTLAVMLADDILQAAPATVVVTSASSRTGRAVARELTGHVEVVGLTSDERAADVAATGLFSAVHGYTAPILDGAGPAAIVDLTGRVDLRARIRQALAPREVRTLVVGATHGGRASLEPGPGEESFLAPDRMRLRAADWGAAGLARHLQEAWDRHLTAARSEVRILHAHDLADIQTAYAEVLAGHCPIDHGHLLTLPAA